MSKIIILSRVSTGQQSLEAQTKELKAEAKRLGYSESNQIILENVESAIKLSEEERIGLQKLKYYIENDNEVDCVICWEPSRLSRRQTILYSIRDYLLEHKIQLYILNPYVKLLTDDRTQIDTTASIVFSLFATISENEMSLKRERFTRAKNLMRQHGQKFGGAVIFGYIKDKNKKCIPDPIKSKIVVDLFNHYIDNDSSLYETYTYACGKWPDIFKVLEYKKAQHKIRHLFDIPVYYTGNWCYPPLIGEELWDKVHEKMSKARCKARYGCKRELLCRGKIYCGHCGRMMTGSGGNTKAYCCSTDKLHSLQINFDVADWIMWEETRSVVNINARFDANDKIQETKDILNEKKALASQYSLTIETLNTQKEKIVDLYIKGKIDETIFDKKSGEIDKDILSNTKQLEHINTEISSYVHILDDVKEEMMKLQSINVDSIEDFETRQEYVRKYINKMIVTRRNDDIRAFDIEFEYTRPIITTKSKYLYVSKNQNDLKVYRLNEDGTEDLIYTKAKMTKRNKETGKFEKKV